VAGFATWSSLGSAYHTIVGADLVSASVVCSSYSGVPVAMMIPAPPVLLAAIPIVLAGFELWICSHYADRANNEYPDGMGYSDKFRHCWTSCMIARRSLNGAHAARVCGLLKELSDMWAGGSPLESALDIVANSQCSTWDSNIPLINWIGAAIRESCEDCCVRKIGRGPPAVIR